MPAFDVPRRRRHDALALRGFVEARPETASFVLALALGLLYGLSITALGLATL